MSLPAATDPTLPRLEGATPSNGVELEKALDVVSDVFVLFDKDFRIVYHNEANKAAMRAAGMDPDAAIGKALLDAMPQIAGTIGERESRRAMEERVVTEWEESYEPDLRLRGRAFPLDDGGLIVVASNISAEATPALRACSALTERLGGCACLRSAASAPRRAWRCTPRPSG